MQRWCELFPAGYISYCARKDAHGSALGEQKYIKLYSETTVSVVGRELIINNANRDYILMAEKENVAREY